MQGRSGVVFEEMKKQVIISGILLVLLFNANAQRGGGRGETDGFAFSGGGVGNGIPTLFAFTLGGNTSTVSGMNGWQTGVRGSFVMGVPISKGFSIRPEIALSFLNTSNTAAGYNLGLNYFELPLLASFNISQQRNFHILIGPEIGFLFSANRTAAGVKTDVTQEVKQQVYSFVGGIDYIPNRFGVSLRYQQGLTDINKDNAGYSGYTRSLSLSLVFRPGYKRSLNHPTSTK